MMMRRGTLEPESVDHLYRTTAHFTGVVLAILGDSTPTEADMTERIDRFMNVAGFMADEDSADVVAWRRCLLRLCEEGAAVLRKRIES